MSEPYYLTGPKEEGPRNAGGWERLGYLRHPQEVGMTGPLRSLPASGTPWCPRLGRPASECHHDGCTHYFTDPPDAADPTPAEALYAAEWEVRKAMGVCCDHDATEAQVACIAARDLLRQARNVLRGAVDAR